MNGNDMAFPCLDEAFTPNGSIQVGLTKREYFAARALQGLCASMITDYRPNYYNEFADDAVAFADALCSALDGGTDGG